MVDVYDRAIHFFLTMARNQFFYDVNKRMGRFIMNGLLSVPYHLPKMAALPNSVNADPAVEMKIIPGHGPVLQIISSRQQDFSLGTGGCVASLDFG
ncbi:MAG: Fic family protein [Desulfobacteraceae bacterium]|nr:Fic family protein [Desulfobacteraceae bacterium]